MRYTHKLDKPEGRCNYFLMPDKEECDNAENKLGHLEDIEEEFGVDLITLLKALSEGFYYIDFDDGTEPIKHLYPHQFWLDETRFCYGSTFYPHSIRIEDYGKKEQGGWALTEEELE